MNKLYNDTTVQAIANAIRAKNGSSDTYTIAEMSTALNDLSYYAKPAISNVPLATFEADGLPLNSLKASIVAKQAGSGTPSPENIRPISGWSEANVSDVGKNLFDASLMTSPIHMAKWVQIQLKANVTYTVSSSIPYSSTSTYIFAVQGTDTSGATSGTNGVGSGHNQTITTGDDGIISIGYRSNGASGPLNLDDYTYQIEVGTQATAYEPYINQTTTIAFPQTVYGGEVDVVNGVLRITDGYIASYNGETLPSTWISSMDEYAEGTTPTTGAEVVYTLASPTTVSLTPTLIKSLEGINNLSVDTGEVIELEYFKEV